MTEKRTAKKGMSGGPGAEKRVDLVLEGGGVKGIALVGALASLLEHGYIPQNIAGTSVGALVGALLAAGYTPAELHDIMVNQFDFRRLKDLSLEGMLPLVGKPLNILLSLGIYEGDALEKQIEEWLVAKGVRTFGDLKYAGPNPDDEPRYHYQLQVIASDLTARSMLVLPRDAAQLGFEPNSLPVAHAVRMSTSVPVFFEPVWPTNREGKQHVIVDGGLLSNYPVWLFDSEGIPEWPTFGLHLVNAFEFTGLTDRIPPLESAYGMPWVLFASYLQALVLTALEARDREYIEQNNFARTIPIPTRGVGVTDFEISMEKKHELYQAGYHACEEFLKTWSFEGYIVEFRSGKQHSRRQSVAEQINQLHPA